MASPLRQCTKGGAARALAVLALDYVKAEVNYRMLRLEAARIGVSRIETSTAPDLMVLDQLQAFLESRPGRA